MTAEYVNRSKTAYHVMHANAGREPFRRFPEHVNSFHRRALRTVALREGREPSIPPGSTVVDRTMSITLPADDEGYTSFECPHCGGRFKLAPTDVARHPSSDLYCALCGLHAERGAFRTREFDEVARAHAVNMAREAIAERLRKGGRGLAGKGVKFTRGRPLRKLPVPELLETPDLAVVELPCCEASVKTPPADALSMVYCPFCGTENL